MDDHRDRRLTEAADLRSALDSLLKVNPEHRASFMHDRLMVLIDSSCAKHGTTKPAFSAAQMLILKDVCYNIVHVLDQKNNQHIGFFRSLWNEWRAKSPFTKISLAVGVLVFITPIVSGWYRIAEPYLSYISHVRLVSSSDDTSDRSSSDNRTLLSGKPILQTPNGLLGPPAANTPSTPVTPGGVAPPQSSSGTALH